MSIYKPLGVKSHEKLKFTDIWFQGDYIKNKKASLRRVLVDSPSSRVSAWLPVTGQHPRAKDAAGRTQHKTPSCWCVGRGHRRPQPRNPNETDYWNIQLPVMSGIRTGVSSCTYGCTGLGKATKHWKKQTKKQDLGLFLCVIYISTKATCNTFAGVKKFSPKN